MALLQVQEGRSALSSAADSGSQHAQQDPAAAPGAWQQFLDGGLPAAQAAAANDAQPGFGSDARAGDGAQAWAASHRGRTQVYHFQLDHLGTPRELTSSDGRIVWSAQYRAWGQLALADVQEIDNPIRFQGQYHDLETGLHYNFQRYYDPSLGRYIHQDPIGLAGGLNHYQYAPNPVGWVDPWGLSQTYWLEKAMNADGRALQLGQTAHHAVPLNSNTKYAKLSRELLARNNLHPNVAQNGAALWGTSNSQVGQNSHPGRIQARSDGNYHAGEHIHGESNNKMIYRTL